MNQLQQKVVDTFLVSHYGVLSRAEAESLGMSCDQVERCVDSGRWAVVHRGVYRRAGETPGPEARLLAACLAGGPGTVASHAFAAWLWQLGPAPEQPSITQPAVTQPAVTQPAVTQPARRSARLIGVERHRRNDLDPARVLVRRGIPVTDPIRTLADLGQVVDADALDEAIDRALARKLVDVDGLAREVQLLARPGRRGVPRLRAAIERRNLVEGPHPSVLAVP